MLPKYEHTQKGSKLIYYLAIFMMFELIMIEAIIYVVGTRTAEPLSKNLLILIMLAILLVHSLIFGLAYLMMSSLTVSIDQEFLRLRFGGGMWKKTIPLNHITECQPVKNTWANGWGIRCLEKGCWLYNIAGLDAVEILLQNGKRIRIGTDEPKQLAEAIHQTIGKTTKTVL